MAGRTLDAIIMETLGIKEMVIARLQWQIEDLKAQVEALQQGEAPQKEQEPT